MRLFIFPSDHLIIVVISHIEDPGHFYVQYSSDTDKLQVLMTQLAEHCATASDHTPIKFSSSKWFVWWSECHSRDHPVIMLSLVIKTHSIVCAFPRKELPDRKNKVTISCICSFLSKWYKIYSGGASMQGRPYSKYQFRDMPFLQPSYFWVDEIYASTWDI